MDHGPCYTHARTSKCITAAMLQPTCRLHGSTPHMQYNLKSRWLVQLADLPALEYMTLAVGVTPMADTQRAGYQPMRRKLFLPLPAGGHVTHPLQT